MPINTSLLISAPYLQDIFIDNVTNLPMSAGVVTCYQDNSRTTLKNWYYQSGTPGNYTYIRLPNPLTLSSAGTIVDVNGNDTIPFFYPYSETDNQTLQPYYITVVNSDGQSQFTRQNFPFNPQAQSATQVSTLRNYIINNSFWRNIGSQTVTNTTLATLAPSQHDGFSSPDLRFIKNKNGAVETITFTKFALGSDPLTGDITPEFYVNHNCTASVSGETQKVYQFPISLHVKTLESQRATVTIQAENVGGNVNNTITLYIYQFLGTGVSSPSPVAIQTITLNDNWQKFTIPFVFPSAQGLTLGSGGDDALYLQIGMPLSVTCDINFTLPSIYLGNDVPTNDFMTYDQIDSVITTPRTGDTRATLNSSSIAGWVLANDGGIGSATSGATSLANVSSWPLYSLLWNNVGVTYAPMVDTLAYGASAIADFTANRAISLTKQLGRTISSVGTPSSGGSTNYVIGQTTGEQLHTMTTAELASHSHAHTLTGAQDSAGSPFNPTLLGSNRNTTAPDAALAIANTGSSTPFNVIQPTSYMNIYFKL